MRSKILLTLYSIVHGPEKQNKKTLKDHILKKGTKLQPTCKTKPKRKKKQAFKMHTLICWNMHTITVYKTSIRTNITKLNFRFRQYYFIKKRSTYYFVCFTFSAQHRSPTLNKKYIYFFKKSFFLPSIHSKYVFSQSCHSVQGNWV